MSSFGQRWARCLAGVGILVLTMAGPAAGLPADAAGAEQAQTGVAWNEIGAKTLDVVVLRPLGAIATVAGFGFFAVSSPIAAASQNISSTWDLLVLAPADYTTKRPLGTF